MHLAFRPRSRDFPGSALVLGRVGEIPVVVSAAVGCSVLTLAQASVPSTVLSALFFSVVGWARVGVFVSVVGWSGVSVRTSVGALLYLAELPVAL
ncbi:MAG: hypothetical protein KVP17_003386 [Porospora cf. gigantea B]|uniref:uncharacterized protein n=1 Tax=Porospora cf. gigantea B TaxID=2853592 RepID=UPI003571853E|nr:MAG: hypothetical protein KVP17_003386 [Porospora cf. gigantea B]